MRYVYLGPEGTFAEQALLTLDLAADAELAPARGVPEALDAVRRDEADAALVPLENSVGGAEGVTLDELVRGTPLMITREVVLAVDFVLVARPGVPLEKVASVAAHPNAARQCRAWLRDNAPGAEVIEFLSNAAAAVGVVEGAVDAAITSPVAAARHGLTVLGERIADRKDSVTRFALVQRPGPPPPATGDDVTSLAVYASHDRAGALLEILTELAVRGVNLTRIESRPTGEKLGSYAFFLDCTGHVDSVRMGEALQGLHRACAQVRFLGSYPRAATPARPARRPAKRTPTSAVGAPAGRTDADFVAAAAWLERLRTVGA